ncbi:MAG: TonB-dependent receptor, partial [Bacteroidota bacterium]|nr:TonB-dependent receptor [Bacteroidota bacterium]
MMNFFHYLILLNFLSVTSVIQAQEAKRELITADFKEAGIEEFVKEIEQQTSYRFYYNHAQFDSFTITATVHGQALNDVLKEIFRNTGYYASIDESKHVFLTKGQLILTELPWSANNTQRDSLKMENFSFNFNNDKNINTQNAFADNKLYEIGIKINELKNSKAVISGYVRSEKNKEPVADASITVDNGNTVVGTDRNGYYSLVLSKGNHTLIIKSFGKIQARRKIILYSDGSLPIELQDEIVVLQNVLVTTQKSVNVNRPQMGVERLNIKSIKQVPTVFGEADLLRVILTLPGVKSVGEASTGFNVRGGAADQNLILFNDATIYNPSHFFGFFSAFNPEIIKDVELYKSSIPSKYGGRLSSVLNIIGREGDKKKFSGNAGLGLLTSRINVEGPIKKDRSSFILGGRTTYSNWLLKLLPERSGYKNSAASFYDVNLLISQNVNENNDLYFTGYFSKDKFNLNSDTVYGYQNKSISLKWKHMFNNKMEAAFTTGYDRYEYD